MTLDVKAKSEVRGRVLEHTVTIERGEVRIIGTGVSWTIETFLSSDNPLSIDLGAGWVLTNRKEVADCVRKYRNMLS